MKVPYIDLSRFHQQLKAQFLEAFSNTIDHGGLCLGSDVVAFENGFSEVSGVPRTVAVGSGTEALHLPSLAMGVGPGDEVIVPAFTFIASAWFAQYVGAKIVFADVDPVSYTLDPDCVEKLITEKTKAIVVVHLYGQAADMDPIMAIAEKHGLKVMEDAAQAHLARYKGTPVGLLGDAGSFSFYPSKNLGALGEGGAIVSKHDDLLDEVSVLRVHGSKERYLNHSVGYNNRMEGLQAASLNVKLPFIEEKTKRRQEIGRKYLAGIQLSEGTLPQPVEWGECVYHVFTIMHPERDRLREHLADLGVGTDVVYPIPLHLQPCFEGLGYEKGDFPVAEACAANCVGLPVFPELTDEEVDYVIESVNSFR